uniref:Glycosyltransferase 61 catalytic domain-containing protein n=1 Tax=viral metagenome TaxID=1070528 RepID=A0A6C0IA17_9ZZZZ
MPIGYEIVDGGQNIPYHLLFYMIVHFGRIPNNTDIIYYFPKGTRFAEKIFDILPKNWIRHYEKQIGYTYTKDHISVPSWPDYMMPEAYDYMRFVFSHHMSNQIIARKYIYISRNRGDTTRQITNEDDVMAVLEIFGFKKIYMEDLTGEEHISIFNTADFIISPHGSALTFTTFCSPTVSIVEILGEPLTKFRHFSHIAWHFGFDFTRFTDVETKIIDTETNNNNMKVDCKKLYQTLIHHKKFYSSR